MSLDCTTANGKLRGVFRKRGITQVCAAFAALVFSIFPNAGAADDVCVPLPDPVNELERAKSLLVTGNYLGFFSYAGRATTSDTEAKSFVASLEQALGTSDIFCETILSEALSPKFRQEIAVIGAPNRDAVYLYWQAINTRDEWAIVNYRLTTDLSEIYTFWK